jgi:hypothetical protein
MADTEGDFQTHRIQSWKKPQGLISPTSNSADEETEAQRLRAINHKDNSNVNTRTQDSSSPPGCFMAASLLFSLEILAQQV